MSFFSRLINVALSFSLLSGGYVLAEEPARTSTVPVELQTMKFAELGQRITDLKALADQVKTVSDLLSGAKIKEGYYTVTLDWAQTASAWSLVFLIPALSGRTAMSFFPSTDYYTHGRKPTNVVIMVSGIVLLVAIAVQAGSTYKLNYSVADKIKADRQLAFVQEQVEVQKQTIATLSQGLGATVNNNIISFEGIPEGLKVIGGSSLNLNDFGVLSNLSK